MNLTALHPYLRTKKDAQELCLIIQKIIDGAFNQNFSIEKMSSKEIPYELKKLIEKLMSESDIKADDKNGQLKFFKQLKEEILVIPVIHMIFAFYPKQDLIASIQDWFYLNYKKTVLLEISIDETIIGGMIISSEGRANDYSLKTKIEMIS